MNSSELDPKYGYLQVTYVTPYLEERELQERVTDFERSNTIRRFMYETPFTKGSQAQGSIQEQYKRRTILVSKCSQKQQNRSNSTLFCLSYK